MADPEERVIGFGGDEFRVSPKIGTMALMRFAHIAKTGADANDLEGLAATYDLLEQCLHPDEWDRFQAKALEVRADGDELIAVCTKIIRGETHRPTERPSDSSDGPPSTPQNSEDDSSSPEELGYMRVVRHWEQKGRPDIAEMVQMAQEAKVTSAA